MSSRTINPLQEFHIQHCGRNSHTIPHCECVTCGLVWNRREIDHLTETLSWVRVIGSNARKNLPKNRSKLFQASSRCVATKLLPTKMGNPWTDVCFLEKDNQIFLLASLITHQHIGGSIGPNMWQSRPPPSPPRSHTHTHNPSPPHKLQRPQVTHTMYHSPRVAWHT